MNQEIQALLQQLEQKIPGINDTRKSILDQLATAINQNMEHFGWARVNFICTHNSRRSQLGQIMMRMAALHCGIDNLYTYSGGTEADAFNYRMVAALERAGFLIEQLDNWENPKYLVHTTEDDPNMDIHFSKRYHDSYNPGKDFIAVMVCNDADEACPFVAGATSRISLPYEDPKNSDDTPREAHAYDQKILEIGSEMMYVIQKLEGVISY